MIEEIKKAREAMRTAEEGLYASQNRLRTKQSALSNATRLGAEGSETAATLQREIDALNGEINQGKSRLNILKGNVADLVGEFVLPQTPRQLISQLDDSLPFLMLPVRVETRFMGSGAGRELWVRVYPDDIAVHTHEKELSRDDADSGVEYWIQRTIAASIENPEEREQLEKGAWRALVNGHGGTRAAWIASEIRKRVIDKEGREDFSFMLIRAEIAIVLADKQQSPEQKRSAITSILSSTHPVAVGIRDRILSLLEADDQIGDTTRDAIIQTANDGILIHLGFNLEELKAESWTRAPRSEVMPDRFVLIGFNGESRLEQPFPAAVVNPLILGPNPQNLESELSQQAGDLVLGEDFDWIANFDKALRVGMAMRVPLAEPFASLGFDRLLVLGIRVSSTAADHKELLEELIDNHHYSPDGMSFLPQGTPTNHTAEQRSGFSTDDAEGDASFETEANTPVVDITIDEFDKTDAKRLSEAWDVELEKLVHLANANRRDVSQARIMNRALWPATLGYYLEEMLQIDPADIGKVRKFFTEHVVARGSLPAIRVGKQPYGILVTSSFRRWQTNPLIDGKDFNFLGQVHTKLSKAEDQWQQLVSQVAHVDAPGDPFAKLLNMLGLHATSVDFQRRIGTHEVLLWNLAHFVFIGATGPVGDYFNQVTARALALLRQLELTFPQVPKLFGLLFNANTSSINGPIVDDVEKAEDEKLSETTELPEKYRVKVQGEGETFENRNYIGWLVTSDLNTLKQQKFLNPSNQPVSVPTALFYRMLHRSLLLSTYDASMTVLEQFHPLDQTIRREQDFTNIEVGRTVTRWEFMEANERVLPQLGLGNKVLGDFLLTADVSQVPAAFTLKEVKDSIGSLEKLKTAELERLFAEHIDLCSYRLDAWQTALFAARLERLNLFRQNSDTGTEKRGIHLGAYGWLENVRPAPPPVPVAQSEIPPSLQRDGTVVVEQPDNAGYIHAPSINHAVAAAVLRNAYLTHATQSNADHFAVRLTSERVRTALTFLEGVRNGQQLGALLGYQFERALHDRYVIEGDTLAQHILAFRKKYPMVADKITPGASAADAINQKESYHVVDGYALLEAVMFGPSPLEYPYGVAPLPDPGTASANAIIAEVERLKDTLDAIADLSLAEGVFQVTQGNYERAGAMLKALSEGIAPPDPEIVNTPRSGAAVNHKLTIHFETGEVVSPWSVDDTPRSLAAPGLNKWLGDLIGGPGSLEFSVRYERDEENTAIPLTQLNLQPIDLIHLIGNQAGAVKGTQEVNDLTELEARIDFAFRLKRKEDDPDADSSQRVIIEFISRDGLAESARSLFELLPLLRNLKKLATTARPLGADDYTLQSEEKTDPNVAGNPKRWDLSGIETAFDDAAEALSDALGVLDGIVSTFPPNALSKDPAEAGDLSDIDYDALRRALIALSLFGLPSAFPRNALLPELSPDATDEQRLTLLRAQQSLIEQARLTLPQGRSRHSQGVGLRNFNDLTPEQVSNLTVTQRVDIYQAAGALVLGDSFRFVPTFQFKNLPELESAHDFSNEVPAEESLLRFTQSRLTAAASSSAIDDWRELAVEEWLEGAAAVRERVRLIDAVNTYQEAFADASLAFKPLQLPFDKKAHWIALEFPEVKPEQLDEENSFVPKGDFLSVVRQLPNQYEASAVQSGLLIDEWNEVIPNRIETTGIAVHYNQPNTEPPQCLLMAVSPNVDGRWDWDDLVDTVIDTFDRAKRRAVEPDFLRPTAYWQLLPAILSSFTSYPHGTISTNIAAQQPSMVVD
ncbi:hypothetical protein [Nitrosospira multiformis]|uniref:Uncharacterized protein n=1 Tax=Nitrosospira multiformis TaxID=1231 RepID=A0A1I7HIA8_9PROT|nr:hypothetical protein [Nitrosospira multiformis]SFU60500.1 hypothetical protein SAMN05216417_109105 [Nitrosospira multiformis]